MEVKNTDLTETAKFIEQLASRAVRAEEEARSQPKIVDLYGHKYLYYDGKLKELEKPPEPVYTPDVLRTYTLDGLIDYIREDNDGLFIPDNPTPLVRVITPTRVIVSSPALGERRERRDYAVCDYEAPRIRINDFCDSEELFVNIQTCFLPDENRDILLRIVNNMTEEQSAQVSDDGISQRVCIKSGVQEVDRAIFKNPAYLRPMRTFTEVTQPESPFIVRFKEGKKAALFEADGGKWRAQAVKSIGAYLRERLKDCNVVVIA